MARWQRKLDLSDVWNKARKGEIKYSDLAKTIIDRLKELKPFEGKQAFIDDEKQYLIEEFEEFILNDYDEVEEFDYLMSKLYDWADTPLRGEKDFFNARKVCWVEVPPF